MRNWQFKFKIVLLIICLFCTVVSRADVLSTTVFYSNKTKVVAE